MARKAARKQRSTPARSPASARFAAGSSWSSPLPDVPLSHPEPDWDPVSVDHRSNLSLRTVRGRLTRTKPAQGVSFGSWSLPTIKRALVCARRAERREVLFARRGTGAGARARKKNFSNRSCK